MVFFHFKPFMYQYDYLRVDIPLQLLPQASNTASYVMRKNNSSLSLWGWGFVPSSPCLSKSKFVHVSKTLILISMGNQIVTNEIKK